MRFTEHKVLLDSSPVPLETVIEPLKSTAYSFGGSYVPSALDFPHIRSAVAS